MKKYNKEVVDIIIPTYDNPNQLQKCIESMLSYRQIHPIRIIIVNNGKTIVEHENEEIIVLNQKVNLGWEGGLKEGLKHSDSKYVMFANDDIFVPVSSMYWIRDMVRYMESFPVIGAIGPSSNVVAGQQNIFNEPVVTKFDTSFLIGFCMLVRREALDKAGGIDDTLLGGDDLDLSIRIRKAGYSLIVRKDIFVYHHGFQTGEKLHGSPDKPGGWNSREMSDNTNIALIKKHGLMDFVGMFYPGLGLSYGYSIPGEDIEGNIIRDSIKDYSKDKVIELGCGPTKTIPEAIGLDIIPKGELITELFEPSVADITADVQEPLPFEDNSVDVIIARHVLEHCEDIIKTLKNWIKVLKPKGKIVIALPNEEYGRTIIMNPEHVHVFTKNSIKEIMELLKMKQIKSSIGETEHSFISIFEKEKND